MKNMKKNQMKVLAVVCAILALAGVGTAIYAGFSSTVNSTGHKGIISSWQVKFGDDATFTDGTAVAGKTLAINGSNDIAPGDSGSFTIKLENNSDVPATVAIDLYNARVGTGDVDSAYSALNQAQNQIRFYKDDAYTEEIAINESAANSDLTLADLKGTVNAVGTYEVTVYWKWISSTDTKEVDGATVNVDNIIAGKTIKLDFSATLKQVKPVA